MATTKPKGSPKKPAGGKKSFPGAAPPFKKKGK